MSSPIPITESAKPALSVVFILAGLAGLGTLSTNIILPSFVDIAQTFKLAPNELGLTLSSFFLAFAAGQLLAGPLSDRFGRLKLVIIGLFVFILGSLLCAVSNDFDSLIAGRIIQGLGVCVASVLSRAIARDLFNAEQLTKVLALIMIVTAAAPGFSPLLGSVLNQYFGWRGSFYLVVLVAVLLLVSYPWLIKETLPLTNRSNEGLKASLLSYWQLANNLDFILPAIVVALTMGGLFGFFASAPSILMLNYQLSALLLGVFFAATVLVVMTAGLMAPHFVQLYGQQRVVQIGLTFTLCSGLMLLLKTDGDLGYFTLCIIVFLLGMGLVNPVATAIALQPVAKHAGLASALLGFLQMLSAALASMFATNAIFAPLLTLGVLMTLLAIVAILSFIGGSFWSSTSASKKFA